MKLWLFAELDGVRLRVKKLLGGAPRAAEAPQLERRPSAS